MPSFSASPPVDIPAIDSADMPKAVSDFDRVENTVSSLMSVSSLAWDPDVIISAFDPLPAGVVLYAVHNRLVFCNRRFRGLEP